MNKFIIQRNARNSYTTYTFWYYYNTFDKHTTTTCASFDNNIDKIEFDDIKEFLAYIETLQLKEDTHFRMFIVLCKKSYSCKILRKYNLALEDVYDYIIENEDNLV